MTDTVTTESAAAPAPSRSLAARLVGVLVSPRATYAGIAARPRWLGALAVVVLLSMAGIATFLSTEVGKTAFLDQQVRQTEAFSGRPMTDVQYERVQRMLPYAPYLAGGSQLLFLPLAAAVIAGLALGVFNAILGADASFKQLFAIVAHSGIVLVVAEYFGLPLAYARESLSGATNLGVFVPFLDDTSFAARLLGAIDLFYVWWSISLAIGLAVLFKKRTGPIAAVILSIYVVIALVVAAIKSVA